MCVLTWKVEIPWGRHDRQSAREDKRKPGDNNKIAHASQVNLNSGTHAHQQVAQKYTARLDSTLHSPSQCIDALGLVRAGTASFSHLLALQRLRRRR